MPKIHKANSNGTLQVTIPKKVAEALNWEDGDTLTPLLLYHKNGKDVVGIGFKLPEGQSKRRKLLRKNVELNVVVDADTGEVMNIGGK